MLRFEVVNELRVALVATILIAAGSCSVRTLGAPDDAQLQLDITPSDTVDAGASARVDATLRLVSGENAGKGWTIELTISGGRIQGDTGLVKEIVTNNAGSVQAFVVAGDVVGPLIVKARARDATKEDTVIVRKKPAANSS